MSQRSRVDGGEVGPGVFVGVGQGGGEHHAALFAFAVFIMEADEPDLEFGGKGGPFFAEGAVGADDVAGVEAMEQLAEDGRVVRALQAFDEVFPAAVGVVEHAHDAHDGKSAAGFLAGGLGVFQLVCRSVVEYEGAAVDGLDDVPLIGVLGPDAGIERGVHAGVGGSQEIHAQPVAALAEGAGVVAGNGQPRVVTPCLDQAHGFGERGVGFEDLGEPRPEHDHVAVMPDSLGYGEPVEEVGGQDVGELHRVGGDG